MKGLKEAAIIGFLATLVFTVMAVVLLSFLFGFLFIAENFGGFALIIYLVLYAVVTELWKWIESYGKGMYEKGRGELLAKIAERRRELFNKGYSNDTISELDIILNNFEQEKVQSLELKASAKNLLLAIAEELQLERIIKLLNKFIKDDK